MGEGRQPRRRDLDRRCGGDGVRRGLAGQRLHRRQRVAVTILLCWSSGRLHDPMPLAALTTVLVFTFDRQEQALAAGLWRCAEIIGGVGIGLVLTAIPFPGE